MLDRVGHQTHGVFHHEHGGVPRTFVCALQVQDGAGGSDRIPDVRMLSPLGLPALLFLLRRRIRVPDLLVQGVPRFVDVDVRLDHRPVGFRVGDHPAVGLVHCGDDNIGEQYLGQYRSLRE